MVGKQNEKKIVPPELDNSVIGTMRINPKPYKVASNKDDISRTKYAVAGLLYMLRREQTIRNVSLTCIIVLILALWLQVEIVHGIIVFISLAMLWVIETMNSAVEAVVDLVTQDLHPLAKVAKDVAASATLVAVMTAMITTLALLGPPLVEKLRDLWPV